ncbi:MAG: tRNA (guanosine(46)-N7)-methyltransferase TrmB [Hyphomicrobiaceae bacterium]|nr:tRNA (guanosine(46)-N7)-methyltransferase TrmB [Hyphomicrobiaceae bacterium]
MATKSDETGDPMEHRAFFGRRRGKGLHKGQKALTADLLPKIEITPDDLAAGDVRKSFLNPAAPLFLEIGYGGGEHLARIAAERPDDNFIGAEVFSGGIGKMLEKIDAAGLANVRLFTDDAYGLLTRLPEAALEGAYLLYPDPWPKTRHHKRRFVSQTALDALARTLKPGAFFRFATDIEDYANWTLAHILRHSAFTWPPVAPLAWHAPYDGWIPTRYEEKARRQGRSQSFYFTFVRQPDTGLGAKNT